MPNNELDLLIRNYPRLTPEQYTLLHARVIEQARSLRAQLLRELFSRLFSWRRRRTAVAELGALDDRMLKDVGLHRSEIEAAVRDGIPARMPDAA